MITTKKRNTPHGPGCNGSFKKLEAQCCNSRCLNVLGPLDFTFKMLATCLMPQLRAHKYAA
eukprot:1302159-Pleurochrysis_carterae.AAC.1